MRRVLCAVVFVAASVGFLVLPAGADSVGPGDISSIALSFDFSDNSAPAAVSNGPFSVTVDVLPEHTPGVIRITADAPDGSGTSPVVCSYQTVEQSQVECNFNFTTSGLWSLRADFASSDKSQVEVYAVTILRVGN
ncbi:MAG: hypothetical protein ABSC34_05740 [Acidimicrobiales bacterium]|jgi:hypothetical protein